MPKLCNYQNCRKQASYGVLRNNPLRCKNHKENMKLSVHICLCGKARPVYNIPIEKRPICCGYCKTSGMVDIINKKCKCGKSQPRYNEPNESKAICCSSCKSSSMIDIVSKRCNCGKRQPIYNEPNELTPICCASCKTSTMINIVNKKKKLK